MKYNKFKIYTLGCKVNQYDSGRLASELKLAGLEMADKKAGLAIVNSCAVTETAVKKCRRIIKLARKENPGAKIILIGCGGRMGENFEDVDIIVKEKEAGKIIRRIMNQELRIMDKKPELAMTDRARYFIKIQDGCEQYCSYCIVPYVRGKMTSRPEREVIDEIRQAVAAGYQEIVLSGIHLGLYGKEKLSFRTEQSGVRNPLNDKKCSSDFSSPRLVEMTNNLTGLLKKLIKIKDLGRIRLSSIEINEVTNEIVELMKTGKLCKHLHLPLQAGSDKILKLMNRSYDVKYFKDKIKTIRRAMPDIAVTTDVIVGFPGETEKDFCKTKNFIKQIKFSRLHVFPFSARGKTPAAKLPNQVDEKIKIQRAKILRQLGVKLMSDYKKKFKGRELDMVVEQIKPGKIMGKTEYYFDIEVARKKIKNKNIKAGEMVKAIY